MSGKVFLGAENLSDDESFGGDPIGGENKPQNRLDSLFTDSGVVNPVDSQATTSLVYTAPKQPVVSKANPNPDSKSTHGTSSQTRVVYATALHAFLLQEGQYVLQGKVGLAVLVSSEKEMKILLYYSNKKPLCQVICDCNFHIKIDKLYVTFVDAYNRQWGIAFEQEIDLIAFAKWMLVKEVDLLTTFDKDTCVLDVVFGEESSLHAGDLAEIDYKEFIVDDFFNVSETKIEESFKFKLGKGKLPVIWESAIEGLSKGGKRWFIVPADVNAQPGGPTSACPTLILVHLKRMKSSSKTEPSDWKSSQVELSVTPTEQTEISGVTMDSLPSVDVENVHSKAAILSRVARVGQPMMPGLPPVSPESNTPIAFPNVPVTETKIDEKNVIIDEKHVEQPSPEPAVSKMAKSPPGLSHHPAHPLIPTRPAILKTGHDHASHPPVLPTTHPYQFPYMFPFMYPHSGSEMQQQPPLPYTVLPMPILSGPQGIDSKEMKEEIRKCHIELQDNLTKLLSQNLDNFSNKVSALSGQLESHTTGFEESEIADNSAIFTEMMQKLTEISLKLDSEKPSTSTDADTAIFDIERKIDSLLSELKDIQGHVAQNWKAKFEEQKLQNEYLTASYERKLMASSRSGDDSGKIKRIMSKFYKSAASEFDPEQRYSSVEIQNTILRLIKEVTLSELSVNNHQSNISENVVTVAGKCEKGDYESDKVTKVVENQISDADIVSDVSRSEIPSSDKAIMDSPSEIPAYDSDKITDDSQIEIPMNESIEKQEDEVPSFETTNIETIPNVDEELTVPHSSLDLGSQDRVNDSDL